MYLYFLTYPSLELVPLLKKIKTTEKINLERKNMKFLSKLVIKQNYYVNKKVFYKL